MLGRIGRGAGQDDVEPGIGAGGWTADRLSVSGSCCLWSVAWSLLVLVLSGLNHCCWCLRCRLLSPICCSIGFSFWCSWRRLRTLVIPLPLCTSLNLCRIFYSCCNRSSTSARADFPLPFLGAGWLPLSGSSVSSSRSASGRSSGSGSGVGTPAAWSTASIRSGSA